MGKKTRERKRKLRGEKMGQRKRRGGRQGMKVQMAQGKWGRNERASISKAWRESLDLQNIWSTPFAYCSITCSHYIRLNSHSGLTHIGEAVCVFVCVLVWMCVLLCHFTVLCIWSETVKSCSCIYSLYTYLAVCNKWERDYLCKRVWVCV